MSKFFKSTDGFRLKLSDDETIAVFEEDDGSVPLTKRSKAAENAAELFFGKESFKVSAKKLKEALREFPDDDVIKISALMHEIGIYIIGSIFRLESSVQDKVVLVAGFSEHKESNEEARV